MNTTYKTIIGTTCDCAGETCPHFRVAYSGKSQAKAFVTFTRLRDTRPHESIVLLQDMAAIRSYQCNCSECAA